MTPKQIEIVSEAIETFQHAAHDAASGSLMETEHRGLVDALEALLAEREELIKDKARLDALASGSWDLRSHAIPTGGDDEDIGWEVIEHHMSEPRERVIGRAYKDDPRAAIDAAMKGEA